MKQSTPTKYQCLLVDPPWPQRMTGKRTREKGGVAPALPYPTMTVDEIRDMDVSSLAADGAHLWLWTTNQFLRDGFDIMEAWGFRYLAPIHWIKPSGVGNWFVSRTQTLLFGYKNRCVFPSGRYAPNIFEASAGAHSAKPQASFDLIEKISPGPRLELFARTRRRGWYAWGNEVESDIDINYFLP
jgi:N6-adenosine-specific RNA methylase IME4